MSTTPSVHNPTGRLVRRHPGVVKLGRVGWFAKGSVYSVAGALALLVAARGADPSHVPAGRRRWYVRLGAVGEVGRGIGIGLVGYFLLRSAVTYDAGQATGLDGALRTLVTKTGGFIVVVVVGIGFVGYGLFCLATFTHRRLEAP